MKLRGFLYTHRTFQRRVARLMDAPSAKTRFQAGLQARDRGWVSTKG
jgi:hypothetical protein